MLRLLRPWPLTAALSAVALLSAPREARACGGTFCDGGNPMPVDQTGEDILFIQDGDQIEVHVRIQYTGEAERFAWMVPLASVPEVSVGSEALFIELGAATIPNWITQRQFEDPDDAPPPSGGLGFVPADDVPDEGPEIVFDEVVGAYEVVVLDASSAADVLAFFEANDYFFEDSAAPIIQDYLDEGFLITGVKLTASASTETIHPLVFRLASDEPCVPIRLTAVAAAQDMGVRAYFLGQDRWAPSNYEHVELNAAAYDWANPGVASYVELLSLAVDEAGGHAFATDYAGPSAAVDTSTVYREDWSAPAWATLTAFEALDNLAALGLLSPATIPPQLRLILREYVPPPWEWLGDEEAFWTNYWMHPDLLDGPAWDAPAFAAELEAMVIEPGMRAVDMLEAWPTLTRLHTTLSPHEMTVDPMFHPTPELPPVRSDRTSFAYVFADFVWTRYLVPLELDGDGMIAEDTRVCVADDGPWPQLDMPAARRIERIPLTGPIQVLEDNAAEISAAIGAHNSGSPCADDSEPPADGGDGEDTGDADTGDDEPSADGLGRGCVVAAIGDAPLGAPLGLGLLGVALIGLRRRR